MKRFLLWAGIIGTVGAVALPARADFDKGKQRGHARVPGPARTPNCANGSSGWEGLRGWDRDRCEIHKERTELYPKAQGRGELHSTLNRTLNEAECKVHGRGKMHRTLNQTLNAKRSHAKGRPEKRTH